MLNFYNSLSPTTKLLITSLLAVLGSVLAGVATAVYQSYILSGQVNLAILWNVAVVTFALLFGKAMHDWVPAHAQQLIQAYGEENTALHDALQRQQTITSNVIAQKNAIHPQQQPAVIVQPPAISVEHVQALSQQIALNLANMAGGPPATPAPPDVPVAQPAQPVDLTSMDTLKTTSTPPVSVPSRNWNDSALMPAVDVPQVPFPGQPVAS